MKPLPYTLDDEKVQANFDALAMQNVNGADVTDGSVTTAKLADGSVTTAKIANGAVTSAQIADSYLRLMTAASHKVTWGTVAVTFDAQANDWTTGSEPVTHGLEGTPGLVLAVPKTGGDLFYGAAINWGISSIGSTTFTVNAHAQYDATPATQVSGTLQFYWLAIA